MENEKNSSTERTEINTKASLDNDTIDALILSDEINADDSAYDKVEQEFDAFATEYRDLISKSINDVTAHDNADYHTQLDGQQIMDIPDPQKEKNKTKKENSDWSDDITLEPEVYFDMPEEKITDECSSEKASEDDLGNISEKVEDDFQITINFCDELNADETQVDSEPQVSKYNPDKPRLIDWVFDIAEMFVFVLCAVMIVTGIFFRHSIVVGDSMNTTLSEGDHLIISDVFYTPERGDIIVFEDFSTILRNAVIKRVIGLPGETVEISLNDDGSALVIRINGKIIDDSHAYYGGGQLYVCEPVTLGENEVFVLGDNRCNSTDSRNSSVGPVDIDTILGKVIVRIYPFNKFGIIE